MNQTRPAAGRAAPKARILILGGTRFIGRQIACELLGAGHQVTVLNRGQSPDDLPGEVERLHSDRDLGNAGLAVLAGQRWDACIDVSGYTAVQVRASAEALRSVVQRYVYVSAVSVYGDPPHGPLTESTPLLGEAPEDVTEVNGETYGPLKVTCERIVRETYGPRATLLRPQIVAGPHDPFPRVSSWVQRALRAGPMFAPGDGSDTVQFIDVQDLAAFARHVIEQDLAGAFNMAGHRVSWRALVDLLAPVDVVWVPTALLEQAGLNFTTLPLFRASGSPRSSLMHVSHARALQHGLNLTPLAETLQRIRDWIRSRAELPDAGVYP